MTPEQVRVWAGSAGDSPLYRHLALHVADTPELMRVLAGIENRPETNMLFGAVHFLLYKDPEAPLARFYPSFSADPFPVEKVGEPFTSFVLEHEDEIVEIGATRYTQTNECRRCTSLLPGIWEASFDRFHLIDLGTSAGLNLAIDRYHYRWNDLEWGPPSLLELTARSTGRMPRPRAIEVVSRIGLDLNPIDPADPEERLWLQALVWPEHHDRLERLKAALEIVSGMPIEFVAGNALETLPEVFDRLPVGEPVVVMNSMVLIQWDQETRDRLEQILEQTVQ